MVLLVFPNAKQVSLPLCWVVTAFQQNENACIQDMLPETCLANISIPLYGKISVSSNGHFPASTLSDSLGNNGHREPRSVDVVDIPDPYSSRKINTDVKLTLPIYRI